MSEFHDFLKGEAPPPGTRVSPKCSICKNPTLVSEVAEYAAGRMDGTIHHTIHSIWSGYFGPKWGMGSEKTLRIHLRMHLGLTQL